MSKADKLQRVAEIAGHAHDLYEYLDDLGVIAKLRAWWRSRPRVIARRKRRAERRAGD